MSDPFKKPLTDTQEKALLIFAGLVLVFFWVFAGIGCWTIVGWIK